MKPSRNRLSDRPRILLTPWWYPSKEDPVMGTFVREHAKAISLHCDVVVLYSSLASTPMRGLYQIGSDVVEEDIRTVRISYRRLPIPKTTFLAYMSSILGGHQYLVQRDFRPDVLHAHEFNAGVAAVLVGKLRRTPVVITEHWSGFPMGLLSPTQRRLARFAFAQADMVCPVSENLKQHIDAYGIRGRFKVVPNAVDTELFSPKPPQKPWRDGKRHILFVGMLISIKGLPYLLEALSHVKNWRDDFVLDIVGDGPNRVEYERLAEDLRLAEQVRFHGTKTLKEVAEFMRRSVFLASASLWENLPLVVVEAMACGKPVIAPQVGGLPEMITPETGILVPPGDIDALSKAILTLLDDYHNYSPHRIHQIADGRYAFEAIGTQYSQIYKDISR